MATDILLIKATLRVLNTLGAHALPAPALANEIEIATGRNHTVQEVEATLAELKDLGYAGSRKDPFKRDVWHITDDGKTAHRTL